MATNEVFKAFSDYMKYEGIEIHETDVVKLVDIYERLVITLTIGESDNTMGINLLFTGDKNIDFSIIEREGIQSIKNYIRSMNSMNAYFPITEATMNSIMDGNNIITVFKHVHHMLNTILAFGKEYIMAVGNNTGVMFSFNNKNDDDGSHMTIIGFLTTAEDIVFKMESDSYIDLIPDSLIRI